MFSLMVYILLTYFLNMPIWVLFFVLLATMFVDVDIRNSRIGNHWYFRPLQWMTKHRGVLHSLFAGIILSLIIGIFSRWGCFGFFVGYISHLFLDCLTKSGVKLFWPFGWKIKGFVKSGGVIEDIIFVLLLLGNLILVLVMILNLFKGGYSF